MPGASGALLERLDIPLVGHEVKPLLVGPLRRGSRTAPRPRSPSTPRSPPTSSTPSLRSQTIADVVAEQLDLDPAAGRGPAAVRRGPASRRCRRSPSGCRWSAALERGDASTGCSREIELPLIPVLARMEADRGRPRSGRAARPRARVRRRDRAARGRDLRQRRPRVHHRQPEAARRDPVRRAEPAQGPQDQDRLLDRRDRPRGAARRPPGDRSRPRLADLHEAALDVRRGAAEPDRGPTAGCTRLFHQAVAATGRLVLVRPEPPEHPDPDAARPPDPARVRGRLAGHHAGRGRLQPDRAADPRPRVRRRAPRATPSPARPTSTARRPPGCSTRRPRTSPPTSGRWPRWSTSGSPTG